jgi:hypothetical protein
MRVMQVLVIAGGPANNETDHDSVVYPPISFQLEVCVCDCDVC